MTPEKELHPPRGIFSRLKKHKILASFVGAVGFLASVAGLYTLSPRFDIRPSFLLSPSNPFSTQFELANNGYLDAVDIVSIWYFPEAASGSKYGQKSAEKVGFTTLADNVKIIRGGEKCMIPMAINSFMDAERSDNAGSATVEVKIEYKIKIIPLLKFKYSQGFKSITNNAGQVQWNSAILSN